MKMKYLANFSLLIPVIAGWFIFTSNSTGSPGGKTGSPGDNSVRCTQCHSSSVTNSQGWITHDIPASGYTPGTTYTITATGTHNGVVKFGFELTAENSSNVKTGTFIITNSTQTKLVNDNNAVTHTAQGTTPSGNTKSWSVNWTAPPASAGTVKFYAAFNAANGNGGTSGDKIYLSNTSVTPNVDATVSVPNVTACPGSNVLIPVNVTNFYLIGALTLYIEYDTSVLLFNSVANINAQFSGMIYNAITYPVPSIGLSWSSLTPATLVTGKLLDLDFTYKKNSSEFVFSPDCEIVNNNLAIVNVIYTSGSIQPLLSINQHPQNVSVYEPGRANFQAGFTGAVQYHWQESTDGGLNYNDLTESGIYSGVFSNSLVIQPTHTGLNGRLYKCTGINGNCTAQSNPAQLTVFPPLVIDEVEIPAGWSGISSYINPVETGMSSIMQPLGNDLTIIQNFTGAYFPSGNVYTLTAWNTASGYFIKLENPGVITLQGYPASPRTVSLFTGWNLIPVLTNCEVNTAILFAFNLNKFSAITEVAGSRVYWPEMGINNLTVLQPGKAYFVKAKQNFSITFPACSK